MSTVPYPDFIAAGYWGFLRAVSLLHKRIPPNGTTGQVGDPVFDQAINGAVAEFLVADLLKLSWEPKIGSRSKGDIGGGMVEVRCRNVPLSGRDLGIREFEQTDTPYVLVHYFGFLDFEIVGWLYGHQAAERGEWNDKRQCFFVPGPYRSMDSLIEWVAGERKRQIRITIAPKDEQDAAKIVANVGGLLEGTIWPR